MSISYAALEAFRDCRFSNSAFSASLLPLLLCAGFGRVHYRLQCADRQYLPQGGQIGTDRRNRSRVARCPSKVLTFKTQIISNFAAISARKILT